MVTSLAMTMLWPMPAGIHSARCGGTTHMSSRVATRMVPTVA